MDAAVDRRGLGEGAGGDQVLEAAAGARPMGAGSAQVAAQGAIEVIRTDVSPDLVQKGLAGIRSQLDKAVGKGKLKDSEAQAAIARLKAGTAEDARGAQFAVEA